MLLRRADNNAMPCNVMRIACPDCQTLYEVPDHLLQAGARRLRCGQCGHGWTVQPPPQPEAQTPDPADEDETRERQFGHAVDAAAKAEIRVALQSEGEPPASEVKLPAPAEGEDRFADLVRAARNNTVELEPDKAERMRKQAANPGLVTVMLVLLVLAVIVVERHAVMRLIPASTTLFHALHLA